MSSTSSSRTIVIVGAGFAGVWAALGAARKFDETPNQDAPFQIVLIAPEPTMYIRPRFYEADVSSAKADLTTLLENVPVQYVQGFVQRIIAENDSLEYTSTDNATHTLHYDRLILATGSKLYRPPIPGISEYSLSTDQFDEAQQLNKHLDSLPRLPDSPARNTVVVCGGGFTGIETAAEMPHRLRSVLGKDADIRVVVVERASELGPDIGPNPRPVILEALSFLGVEIITGETVTSIDTDGITTASGLRILSKTVVWTAGLRASQLTEQLPAERDTLGRLIVDKDLRVSGLKNVFAAGDVARAATDDEGHFALMSCQHSLILGRFAGYNAAADLLGLPTRTYRQVEYSTCLDLGPWGAVFTKGWDRNIVLSKSEAKALKTNINTKWIYPPQDSATALAEAEPDKMVVA